MEFVNPGWRVARTYITRAGERALFTVDQRAGGQGAVLISGAGVLAAPENAFPGSRPARRGEFLEIYAVGLGPVTNRPASGVPASGNPLSTTTATTTALIGDVAATVAFSGLAPGFVGLYQMNVQVPQSAPTGSAAPLVISVGGVASNNVTVAVQ